MSGVDSYLNSYLSPYLMSYGSDNSIGSLLSSSSALTKAQAQSIVDGWASGGTTGTTSSTTQLKADTANYLDRYAATYKQLGSANNALRFDNLDKLLYNSDGEVTEETVKATVDSVQKMLTAYNDTIKLLNDNATRGAGSAKQLAKMVADPMSEKGMELLGITVNKDGTLSMDAEKLTANLSHEDAKTRDFYKDLLGGVGGLADKVNQRVSSGMTASAKDLINNDLANIQGLSETAQFSELYATYGRGAGAYAMNNSAAVGMMMNLMA